MGTDAMDIPVENGHRQITKEKNLMSKDGSWGKDELYNRNS